MDDLESINAQIAEILAKHFGAGTNYTLFVYGPAPANNAAMVTDLVPSESIARAEMMLNVLSRPDVYAAATRTEKTKQGH